MTSVEAAIHELMRQACLQLNVDPEEIYVLRKKKSGDDVIDLTLDYPPSANRYWRSNGAGRVYKSEEARNYIDDVYFQASRQKVRRLGGTVCVALHLYRPSRRGDLDNRLKVMLDALQGIAYENDSQIEELHVFRHLDRKRPRVELQIWEING